MARVERKAGEWERRVFRKNCDFLQVLHWAAVCWTQNYQPFRYFKGWVALQYAGDCWLKWIGINIQLFLYCTPCIYLKKEKKVAHVVKYSEACVISADWWRHIQPGEHRKCFLIFKNKFKSVNSRVSSIFLHFFVLLILSDNNLTMMISESYLFF